MAACSPTASENNFDYYMHEEVRLRNLLYPFLADEIRKLHGEYCSFDVPDGQECCQGLMKDACLGCWAVFLIKPWPNFEFPTSSIDGKVGTNYWYLGKMYMARGTPADRCNSPEETDINGLYNILYHCPLFRPENKLLPLELHLTVGLLIQKNNCNRHSPDRTMETDEKYEYHGYLTKLKAWVKEHENTASDYRTPDINPIDLSYNGRDEKFQTRGTQTEKDETNKFQTRGPQTEKDETNKDKATQTDDEANKVTRNQVFRKVAKELEDEKEMNKHLRENQDQLQRENQDLREQVHDLTTHVEHASDIANASPQVKQRFQEGKLFLGKMSPKKHRKKRK